ncbi:helix-turn-helix transcriptional regulator [Eubacteriales bacterium OttesenSCG-928-M02]|nr:helix-turn-helix transcriptional regulator [Eubacteriales bacterium OttesenSCG-928-M02]
MEKQRNENCPVSATLHLIGGKYKALLLWHLTDRTLRFSELQKLVPEATPKMLTQQLRELEAEGLIHREVYPVVPPKVEYSLTDLGKSLFPILEAMYHWGAARMEEAGLTPSCSMSLENGACTHCTEKLEN